MKSVYIIAEAGVNHNGKREIALELIEAAADAGADAVKFQTFSAKRLTSETVRTATYQKLGPHSSDKQRDMLTSLELPLEWHGELKMHAESKGLDFLSTPFDHESATFLAELGMPYFKIPSGELVNASLLWRIAKIGKPLIVSTGMSSLSEVEFALAVINHALTHVIEPTCTEEVFHAWSHHDQLERLRDHVTLLHCTTQYPTPMNEVNLEAMTTLRNAFRLPVGYSDHTAGIVISLAAVAMGATIIEKHLTLDRSLPGPDHTASLEPAEFSELVQGIRMIELASGSGIKSPQASEWSMKTSARQQLVAAKVIPQGTAFAPHNLTTKRSGEGLSAMYYWDVIGKLAKTDYQPGEVIEL